MKITFFEPRDYKKTPWKNGRGFTTEIAISPAGATLENFDWRVSSATVSEDGEFSSYAGYTRDLAVIDGDGLLLTINGKEERLEKNQVFRFDGADKVHSRVVKSEVQDLNLIFRKSIIGTMEISDRSRTQALEAGMTCFVLVVEGDVSLELPRRISVQAKESVLIRADEQTSFQLSANGVYALMTVASSDSSVKA